MNKLIMAVAGAMAVVFSAYAAENVEWFNGGVAEGFPTAGAGLSGGAWANVVSGEDVQAQWDSDLGKVKIESGTVAPLEFVATSAKTLNENAESVTFKATLDFTAFESASMITNVANAKAGIALVTNETEFVFYVLAIDAAAYPETNMWTATTIAGTYDEVPVSITVVPDGDSGTVTYKIGENEENVTVALPDSQFQRMVFVGDAKMSALSGEFSAGDVTLTLPEDPEHVETVIVSNLTQNAVVEKDEWGQYSFSPNDQAQIWIYAEEGYLFSNGKNFKMYEETMDEDKDYSTEEAEEPTYGHAKIGSVYYLTLNEAINAAEDGDTVDVVYNTEEDGLAIAAERFPTSGLTINLGGLTVTLVRSTAGNLTDSGMTINVSNRVTIVGGMIEAGDETNLRDLIRLYGHADNTWLTLNGVNFNTSNRLQAGITSKAHSVVTVEGGNCTITGNGSITSPYDTEANTFYAIKLGNHANETKYSVGTLTVNGKVTGDILITGGTYVEGANADVDGNYYYGKNNWSSWEDANNTLFAARTGVLPETGAEDNFVGQLYKSLSDAIDAVEEDDTLSLLKAAGVTDVATIDKTVSLDLNGNTFTVAYGDLFQISNGAELDVKNSATDGTGGLVVVGDVEVDGVLDLYDLAYGAGGLIAHQGGQLKIGENGKVTFMQAWSGISPNLLKAQTTGFMTAKTGATVNTGKDYIYNGEYFAAGDAVAKADRICTIVGTEETADFVDAFDTLDEALKAVKEEGTVTLLANNEEEGLTIPETATLDLTDDYSIVTNGLVNNGTIKIYQPAGLAGFAKLEEYANVVGTLLAAEDITDSAEAASRTMFYPEGTTLTLTTETIGENVRPTLTVEVPATKTVLWKNGVAPYKKMVVNGNVQYAGDISYGWNAETLPTELEVAGNLTLLDCVVITNFGSIKVTGGDLNVGNYDICLQSTTAKVIYDGNLTIGEDIVTSVPNGDVVYKDGVYSVETEVIEYAKLTITAGDNVSNVVVTNAAGVEVTGETKFVKSDATVVAVKSYTLANGYELDAANSVLTVTLSEDAEIEVNAKPILVTGVTLDITSTNVAPEAVFALCATVTPDTALDKTIVWITSDEAVAAVDNGTVTAVAAGTATITATNAASGVFATCTVTVEAAGPTPGSDTKITPVPGEENTYKVEPTGSSTVVEVDNVTPGDKLVISATVTEIHVQGGADSGAIIRVRNSGDTADIPNGAMYGWDGNSFGTALDPDGSVTDEVTGDEIPVTPTIGEETDNIEIDTPFQAGDTPSATVLAIPGLTYQLMRSDEPSSTIATSGEAASEATVATDSTITLTDGDKPEGKAFYQIKVTK